MALKVRASIVRHPYFIPVVGMLLSLAALWTFGRPRPEVERARRHFVELQRQRGVVQLNQDARTEFRRRATDVQGQLDTANQDRRGALNVALAELWAQQLWSDRAGVRDAVLATPLIPLPGAPPVSGTVAVYSARHTGCASCHVAVATPGFERFPEPFRTHVQLSSYVGADSPHPPSRMGCGVCHQGNDAGESFIGAGHSTLRTRATPEQWRRALNDGADASRVVSDVGQWADAQAPGVMLPVGRVGAGCARCHAGERFQPGAVTRNDALTSMDRAGCYSCHEVQGLTNLPRRGPDLRRISGKLTPQWTRQWIAEPTSIKPATWMPRVWRSRQVLQSDDRAEVDAVIAYLFANAERYTPAVATPPRGDAARGERLVSSVGCLGCHVVGAVDREATSLARLFGPPLQSVGSKLTYAWLYDWIREPSRYNPGTRMPRLPLTDAEAADIASYLTTLTGDVLDTGQPEHVDARPYQDVVRRYVGLGATAPRDLEALGVDDVRRAAGRAVIEVRGCFNCHEIRGFEGKRRQVPLTDMSGDTPHVLHRPPTVLPPDVIGSRPATTNQSNTPEEIARPTFTLGPLEWDRLALGSAISVRRQPDDRSITVPWHVAKTSGRALIHRFNCVGCHVADGAGGDVASVAPASAGRAPDLDTVGSRLTVAQLRAFLRQPTSTRRGETLRMPTFALSDDEIAAMSGYLQAIAPASRAPVAGASQTAAPARSSGR